MDGGGGGGLWQGHVEGPFRTGLVANVFIATLPHFENFINFSYSLRQLFICGVGQPSAPNPWASQILQVNVLHSPGILYAVGVSISNTMGSFIPLQGTSGPAPFSQTHSNALSETKLICINTFHK